MTNCVRIMIRLVQDKMERTFMFVDNIVASAATNGVVIVWDLNSEGRSKQGNLINFV